MPGRGRRQGRGQGRGRAGRKAGLLQPCLLLQLLQQDRHGYDLLQGLEQYTAMARDLDPSIVYRLLRDMEAQGLVRSYEGSVSRGPRRRVYTITADGTEQLRCWVDELEKTRREIDLLVASYRTQGAAE